MEEQEKTMKEIARDVSQILKILANENRLLILCVLIESPLTVTQIQEKIAFLLSQHPEGANEEEREEASRKKKNNDNTSEASGTQAISSQVSISQSALSQHLALLKAYHIVKAQKNGQFVQYSIQDTKVAQLMGTLKDLYCK